MKICISQKFVKYFIIYIINIIITIYIKLVSIYIKTETELYKEYIRIKINIKNPEYDNIDTSINLIYYLYSGLKTKILYYGYLTRGAFSQKRSLVFTQLSLTKTQCKRVWMCQVL